MLSTLPNELRFLIISCLRRNGCSLASLAATSCIWRDLIEPQNFAHITLTPCRLHRFKLIAPCKRHFVRAIWFRIDLEDTRNAVWETNSKLIESAFRSLFSTLSLWDPSDGDLALDLSVFSPWDTKPCFAHIPLKPDLTDTQCDHDQELGLPAGIVHNLAPTASQLKRAFDQVPDYFTDEMPFPSVPVITSVNLRQQNRLQWLPFDLASLFSQMPRLEQVHYEPWRAWSAEKQLSMDEEYTAITCEDFTPALRRLIVSENFSEHYMAIMQASSPREHRHQLLTQTFAHQSLKLEMLSVSFMVEAGNFFDQCKPSWTWPDLTSPTLTSQLLTPSADANSLFRKGAEVAMQMPHLKTMEIWNGRAGLAGMFQYRLEPGLIIWKGTWNLKLEDYAIQAWQAVASLHGVELHVWQEMLDETKMTCVGSAVHHLGHSERVFRPVSLRQVRIHEFEEVKGL
ncbi:unnamed protein product [Clonostachys chloroleuca]|uniref:DUF6546 domain-containing protein n=1 Tax=Clonostachys chloroleuca TaxID=1926264 RepID=A0AA35VAI5_9HYPO|nr:unnamed protein product [Clonostachys chloroleuca]